MSNTIRILPSDANNQFIHVGINGVIQTFVVGVIYTVDDETLRLIEEAGITYTFGPEILDGDLTDIAARLAAVEAALADADLSADPADAIYPDQFDPLAVPGTSYDCAAAIQAMFDQQLIDGRLPTLRPKGLYKLGSKITADPSRNTLNGQTARLDWSLKDFIDPESEPELMSNSSFDSGSSGWTNTVNQTMPSVYSGGQMTFDAPDGSTNYLEMGQLIGCAAGTKLQITVTGLQIKTIASGANTFRSCLVTLRRTSVQGGTNVGSLSKTIKADNTSIHNTWTTIGDVTWEVTTSEANPYLRFQSNAGIIMDALSIRVIPDNVCLLMQVPPSTSGGQLRGHNYRFWRDFKMTGRSGQGRFVDMIRFDTPQYTSGDIGQQSRTNFYNIDISDNVGRALIMANRTYLNNFYSCRMVASEKVIETIEGSVDAGENISFYGGNIGGAKISVYNPAGFQFFFFGVSSDFSKQHFVGKDATFIGCHLESDDVAVNGNVKKQSVVKGGNTINGPISSQAPWLTAGTQIVSLLIGTTTYTYPNPTYVTGYDEDTGIVTLDNANTVPGSGTSTGVQVNYILQPFDRPLIDVLDNGFCILQNCSIQMDGSTSDQAIQYCFYVRDDAMLSINDCKPYLMQSATDVLCGGSGRFLFQTRWREVGTTRNIASITKLDDEHNIIGAAGRFETTAVEAPVFFVPSSTQECIDRFTLANTSLHTLTADVWQGEPVLTGVVFPGTPSTIETGIITNAECSPGAQVMDYYSDTKTINATTAVRRNTLTSATNGSGVGGSVTTTSLPGNIGFNRYVYGTRFTRPRRINDINGGTITLNGPVAQASTLEDHNAGDQIILSAPWNGPNASGVTINYKKPTTQRSYLRMATDYAYLGAQSLEIFKGLFPSDPTLAYLCLPVIPGRSFGMQLYWAVPPSGSLTGTGDVFFQTYLMALSGLDDGFSPVKATQKIQITDLPKTDIPLDLGTNGWDDTHGNGVGGMWRKLTSSLNTPGLGLHDGYVPEWATHFVVTISLGSMKQNSRILIDAVHGNHQ